MNNWYPVNSYVDISDKADKDLSNVENDVFEQKIVDSGYTPAVKIKVASGNTMGAGINCPANGVVAGEIVLDLPEGVSRQTHTAQASIRVRDTTICWPVITGMTWRTEEDVTRYVVSFSLYNPTAEEIQDVYVIAQAIFFDK